MDNHHHHNPKFKLTTIQRVLVEGYDENTEQTGATATENLDITSHVSAQQHVVFGLPDAGNYHDETTSKKCRAKPWKPIWQGTYDLQGRLDAYVQDDQTLSRRPRPNTAQNRLNNGLGQQ